MKNKPESQYPVNNPLYRDKIFNQIKLLEAFLGGIPIAQRCDLNTFEVFPTWSGNTVPGVYGTESLTLDEAVAMGYKIIDRRGE